VIVLLLFFKTDQIQAGASWDTIIAVSIGMLLVGGVALLVVLAFSRLSHDRRVRRAKLHSRHRHQHTRSKSR
jgi:hypothetical protein